MKILNIGGKDYKIMFTFEASLYRECVEQVTELLLGFAEGAIDENFKIIKSHMRDIPSATLIMFHAALLEENPTEDMAETKNLLKQYFMEHKGDETDNFYGFMQLLLECMGEDGFFKQIGMEQMLSQAENQEENEVPKIPQDHKPKAVRARKTGVKS